MPQIESGSQKNRNAEDTLLDDSDGSTSLGPQSSDTKMATTTNSLKRKLSGAESSPWNDQIVILVGPDAYKLTVHTHIVRKIPFFRACLDVPMLESQSRTVTMEEDDPLAVEGLVHWAYTGRLEYDLHEERKKHPDDSTMRRHFTSRSVQLYALAKKCMDEELQNKTLTAIITAHENMKCPALTTIKESIDVTGEDDHLRMYMMQRWAEFVHRNQGWIAMKKAGNTHYKDFAAQSFEYMEFAIDSLARFPEGKRAGKLALALDKCVWHTHTDTQRCPTRPNMPATQSTQASRNFDMLGPLYAMGRH